MSRTKRQELDMLNGSIWNKIPMFALPVAATAILQQLFNAADIAVVGNFTGELGTTAVAAVGANSSIIGLIVNLFVGISLGANVTIANAIGKKDEITVKHAVHTSLITALAGGLLVMLLGQIIAGPLLGILNIPGEVLPYALLYLRIYLLGMPFILLYNFEAAIFRSIGNTKVPLQALLISGILNVILNLIFVICFGMNVNGVAIATITSNFVSSLILLFKLMKTDSIIKVERKYLTMDKKVLIRILKIGLPAGIQSAVFSIANIIVQSAINSLGTVVMAASSAAFNIEIVAYYVVNSFSQACTTFVGQNYGAGKIDRCRKTLILCFVEDAIASISTIAIVLASGRFLLSIFDSNPEVIEIGYTRLVIILSANIFAMLYEIMSSYLRGFGISLAPAILTTLGVCVIRISWIKWVFPAYRSFQTIMIVYPVSLAATAVLIFIALMAFRPAHKLLKNNMKSEK